MKIGIDTLFLIPGKHGGTETYLRNLLLNLAKIDKENEYILFTNKENSGNFGIKQDNFSEVLCNFSARYKPIRVFYEQMILPIMARRYQIDVLHFPAYVSLAISSFRLKSIVTIHDIMFHYYPENYPKGQLLYFKHLIPASAKRGKMIIAVSNNTKKDIIKILEIPENKVTVTYEAPDERFNNNLSDTEKDRVKKIYNLPDRFILSVASFNPHKNIDGLIRSFSLIKKNYDSLCQLVLVGMKSSYYSKIISVIEKLKLDKDVLFIGHVSDKDLPYLYSLANIYVFPSFFEGFGLPPLEAMACGCPVVASNVTSIPEVVGEAGILIDPHNIEKMAEAIYKVLINDNFRRDLIRKGFERAKQFSWEKTAKETLKVYEEVAHS